MDRAEPAEGNRAARGALPFGGSFRDGSSDHIALALVSITKRFGQLLALDGASLTVRRGTVHALLGENGAGKTTLMRIAFGLLPPDKGTLWVNAQEHRFRSPSDAIAAGIGMVHQHFMLVPAMSVTENIALGWHGRYDVTRVRTIVHETSVRTQLHIDPDALVRTLSIEAQQRVEILKALAREATILILDEPTAVLAPTEAKALLHNMRVFVATGGTVILITHKLRDVWEFSDDVTVLRHGRTVLMARASDLDERTLAAAMVGSASKGSSGVEVAVGREVAKAGSSSLPSPSPLPPSGSSTTGERGIVFRLRDVFVQDNDGVDRLRGVTLTVHAGEILGIAAVEGNGQYELLRILAKRLPATSGFVETPDDVGFIPEDRQRDALILDFTLSENVALLWAGQRHGMINWRQLRDITTTLMRRYDIRAQGSWVRARTLSGGNQQKLIVGRELEGAPRALVAENPTHGLDVQATALVHQRLREARDRGTAIVFYSSDLDEVLGIADRVVVIFDRTVNEVRGDREQVGRAMLGRIEGDRPEGNT